ncbi:MAG: hypothetical protein KDA51_06440 [Planctomycetales bacterium]|nr:hypothetical protein [Planctomycetales bacterium]
MNVEKGHFIMFYNLHAALVGLAALSLALPAHAADIVFEFSGVLDRCTTSSSEDCGPGSSGEALAALDLAPFSGTLTIPATASERTPDRQNRPFGDEMLWSFYDFGQGESSFHFDTLGEEFDLVAAAPVTVLVSLCEGPLCAPNQSFVFFTHESDEYRFTLALSRSASAVVDATSIPGVDTLSLLTPGFEIANLDFSAYMTVAYLDPLTPDMSVQVSVVPVPAAWIFVLSALACFRCFRSESSLLGSSPRWFNLTTRSTPSLDRFVAALPLRSSPSSAG